MVVRILALLLASSAGLLACNGTEPSLESVTAIADHSSYVAPATVVVTLTNTSSQSVVTDNCAKLQRHDGDTWTDTSVMLTCLSIERELRSGHSTVTDVQVPQGTPPGEYRAVVGVLGSNAALPVATQPFTVE